MVSALQYVVRGKQAIGFLLSAGSKGYRAFDQDGRPIGLFEDEDKAAAAVYKAAATDTISNSPRPMAAH
jgi:hypothetical protein